MEQSSNSQEHKPIFNDKKDSSGFNNRNDRNDRFPSNRGRDTRNDFSRGGSREPPRGNRESYGGRSRFSSHGDRPRGNSSNGRSFRGNSEREPKEEFDTVIKNLFELSPIDLKKQAELKPPSFLAIILRALLKGNYYSSVNTGRFGPKVLIPLNELGVTKEKLMIIVKVFNITAEKAVNDLSDKELI
jgi:hypothetical protein